MGQGEKCAKRAMLNLISLTRDMPQAINCRGEDLV